MILIWIVVGGLVGVLAGRARGRVLDGVFLGAVLGPVGWLIMLCSRDYRLRCIECGGILIEGARKCQHCGSVVDKQFQIRCPKCGHMSLTTQDFIASSRLSAVCQPRFLRHGSPTILYSIVPSA